MKNLFLVVVLSLVFIACKNKEDKKGEETIKKTDSSTVQYSQSFLQTINTTLTSYYALKDAFVASDTVKINVAGVELKSLLDSLKLDELYAKDTLAFASINGRPGDVSAEIAGMLGEKELERKRESFELISNGFYDMMRAIRPTGTTIYYQYCPMAFNDKGAYWLSNADSIRNPYFGKKMLTCGEVKETMNY